MYIFISDEKTISRCAGAVCNFKKTGLVCTTIICTHRPLPLIVLGFVMGQSMKQLSIL